MGKEKAKKANGQVPHRHLRARISYLYQAATYMQSLAVGDGHFLASPTDDRAVDEANPKDTPCGFIVCPRKYLENNSNQHPTASPSLSQNGEAAVRLEGLGQPRRFINHLRAVSLKSQIRLSSAMKHSMCKRCDSLLVSGSTSASEIENHSRGGKKAWADVLVITCHTCGFKKRFPTGTTRQPRRTVRGESLGDKRTIDARKPDLATNSDANS